MYAFSFFIGNGGSGCKRAGCCVDEMRYCGLGTTSNSLLPYELKLHDQDLQCMQDVFLCYRRHVYSAAALSHLALPMRIARGSSTPVPPAWTELLSVSQPNRPTYNNAKKHRCCVKYFCWEGTPHHFGLERLWYRAWPTTVRFRLRCNHASAGLPGAKYLQPGATETVVLWRRWAMLASIHWIGSSWSGSATW